MTALNCIAYRTAQACDLEGRSYIHGAFNEPWTRHTLSRSERASRPEPRETAPLRMEEANGWLSFPDHPRLAPIRRSFGALTVVAVVERIGSNGARDTYVHAACACGGKVKRQISPWRSEQQGRCIKCARADSRRIYNPVPATTYAQREERTAEMLRLNPMGARVPKREPVAALGPMTGSWRRA